MAKARPKQKLSDDEEKPTPNPLGLWARLGMTLLPMVVLIVGRNISLPNVDVSTTSHGNVSLDQTNVMVLGVMPMITAALLVEVVAVIVPRWRHLRHGGYVGRAKLQRATNFVFLGLAFFQGYATATYLQSQMLMPDVGMGTAVVTALTLVAGAAVLKLAADVSTARGLVNGYGVIATTWCLIDIVHDVGARHVMFTPLVWLAMIAKIVAIAGLTFFVMERMRTESVSGSVTRRDSSGSSDSDNPYAAPNDAVPLENDAEKRIESTVKLPSPVSGIGPYSTVWSILALPAAVAILPGMQKLAESLENPVLRGLVTVSLLFSFTFLLGWLFHQPRRVAALYELADESKTSRGRHHAEAREALRHASFLALLYMLALLVLDLFTQKYVPMVKLSTVSFALVTVVLVDFAKEWRMVATRRDLVSVWPEHRPYAIPVVRDIMHRAGIFVHIRDERQRRLLQFGATYVPIEICVPAADAQKAGQFLEKVLLAKPVSDALPEESAAPVPMTRRLSWSVLAGIVGLAVAALALSLPEVRPAKVDQVRTTKLEFVLTDDEHSIVDQAVDFALEERLRVHFESEEVALGPGKTATKKYAVVQVAEGETVDAARLRLEEWLASFKVPAGTRAAIGEYQRYDSDRGHFYVAGWRTYLLKGSAILTEKDVYEAQAMPDANSPGHWLVRLVFTSDAGARFEQVTGENIKRRFAILLDGRVTSAPVIQSKIPGGVATITMGSRDPEREREDAQNLEKALNGD